ALPISTAVMIKLGRVEDNRMVDMQLTNNKLIERGTAMISQTLGVNSDTARQYLLEEKSVRKAIEKYR
ncbi:MAG TPA: N-acetylmuramic acid 6-phosphate etherase, partial [Bacteroidetes bacterium]|nr:N-acetylmuramic acid 6-phosphate etherase [Bacteroidota bacterium]